MSSINEIDFRDSTSPSARPRRTQRIRRILCGTLLVIVLPFFAGCAPELLIGGAIVGSVLYAHANKDNLPTRPERVPPSIYQGRAYASSAGPMIRSTASTPPTPKVQPRPDYRPSVRSSAAEHTVPAGPQTTSYESRSRTDSRITGTTPTAEAPPAPKPPPAKQPARVSPVIEGALAYREMRWEDAVRILSRAINMGTCTTALELNGAQVLLGAIAYQQGDAEAARTHFLAAHRHDAQTEPSPQLFPPQLIDFYRTVNGLQTHP